MKVSVIIPVYNEEKNIEDCIDSLIKQTMALEIIVIDDGSTDRTSEILSKYIKDIKILKQGHLGPAVARNLGVNNSSGEILVFVDADMEFENNFVKHLIEPILDKKTIGTFSKEEYVLNPDNVWSKCWNLEKGLPTDRMHNPNHPTLQPVFRAILKKEFLKGKGFDPVGYVDDYTLSKKLGVEATLAEGAKYYHRNPQSLKEVFKQARWIGKSEFKYRKVKSENLMRLILLIRHSPPLSILNGLLKAIKFSIPHFFLFKLVYDLAVEISLIRSFFGEQKNK